MDNSTNDSDNEPRYEVPVDPNMIPVYLKVTVTSFYALIFTIGIAGNILVTIVISRHRELRNSTNFFLFNLSVADILVLAVTMPTALMEVHTNGKWYLGEHMCRLVQYVENMVVSVSTLTIVAISFERYYAICHPFKAKFMCTPARSVKIVLGIWVVASALAVPFVIYTHLTYSKSFRDGSDGYHCATNFATQAARVYLISNTVIFYVLPVLLLIGLYSPIMKRLMVDSSDITQAGDVSGSNALQQRRQAVYMLISIKTLFFISMLPYRTFTIFLIAAPKSLLASISFEDSLIILYFTRIMFYLNSSGNPVLYNLLSTTFREAFFQVLGLKRGRRMLRSFTSGYHSGRHTSAVSQDSCVSVV